MNMQFWKGVTSASKSLQ